MNDVRVTLPNGMVYVVVCHEYPNAEAALASFERVLADGEEVSCWRTATPDLARHFVLACWRTPHEMMDEFDWQGTPVLPDPEQVEWAINRRFARAVTALASGEARVHERLHHGPEGMRIPGGAS